MDQGASRRGDPTRRLFCNRTLNMRSIEAIGYDMDYTLVHYNVGAWERCAFEHIRNALVARGWGVEDLAFDPELVVRGLVVDRELGNLLKCNRFGRVKQACHGTRMLDFEEVRAAYQGVRVDVTEERFHFLTTLFSLSEGCLWLRMVDLADADALEGPRPRSSYDELFALIRRATDHAHMEGKLKAAITAEPDRFVEPDPDLPLALLDQKHAGKKLLLITNSEWEYTARIMTHAFDPHLEGGTTWRDLFDHVIVSARKPSFFRERNPLFEIVDDDGLLRPCHGPLREGGLYLGGNATLVEESLGLSGAQILYVGDHVETDINASKQKLSWRTALVLRELEDEIEALSGFRDEQRRLEELMLRKGELEHEFCRRRLEARRLRAGYGPTPQASMRRLAARQQELRNELMRLDEKIGPIAARSSRLGHSRWGPLMRAGNDKSHLARQVENWADVYTSRVSNFLEATPYFYLRSPRGSLPHDPQLAPGDPLGDAGPATEGVA